MEKEMRKEMKICIGENKMRKGGIGQGEGYYSILKVNILHHCFLSLFVQATLPHIKSIFFMNHI